MNSNNTKFFLFLFFIALTLVSAALAEEKKHAQESTITQISSSTTSQTLATTTSTTLTEELIEPLESWDQKVLTSTTSTTSTTISTETGHTEEAPKPPKSSDKIDTKKEDLRNKIEEELELDLVLQERKTILFKKNKLRLEEAKKNQAKIIREQEEKIYTKDSRGPVEIVLCAVNVNGYGLKKDFSQKFSKERVSKYDQLESSLISAIEEKHCNLAVLINFLAPNEDSLNQGSLEFSQKLSAKLTSNWQYFVGPFSFKNKYSHVFFTNSPYLKKKKVESFENVKLPKFEKSFYSNFPISPVKMTFNYGSSDSTKTKEIIILASFLGSSVGTDNFGTIPQKMQLAETNRILMKTIRENIVDDEGTSAFLAIDLGEDFKSLPAKIIEGRLRLKDFLAKGSCKLDKEYKAECSADSPTYIKELFGIMNEGLIEDRTPNPTKIDIYFYDKDLKLALQFKTRPGYYKRSFQEVKNGLKNSYLVATELNW